MERATVYTLPHLNAAQDGTISVEQWQELLARLDVISQLSRNEAGQRLLQEAASFAIRLPEAMRFLKDEGVPQRSLDAMQSFQVLAMYAVLDYEHWSQDAGKWYGLPYFQAHRGLLEAERAFSQAKGAGKTGPLSDVVPAGARAYKRVVHLDRKIAMLRVVEAIRAYMAEHEGAFPSRLSEMADVPIPLDPMTGTEFGYQSSGERCVLIAPAPAGEPFSDEMRYILTR